jgi:hypothetical protein
MRLVFFAVCLSGFTITGNAQLKIGVKAGINISNQVNPFVNSFSFKPSYSHGQSISRLNASLFTQFPLFNEVLLRVQLGLAGQGYSLPTAYDQQGNQVSPSQKFNLGYLSLPVQLIYPVKLKAATIWLGGGPFLAFLVDGHVKMPSSTEKIAIGYDNDSQFRPFDFGITPTACLKLNNGFLAGIDYNLGLADVSHQEGSNRNVSWSFYLGYLFK